MHCDDLGILDLLKEGEPPLDRQDLDALAEIHGELPLLPIPGLDDER